MRRNKLKKLARAFLHESQKRLPYVFLVMLILLLIQGWHSGARIVDGLNETKNNTAKLTELGTQIADLSKENLKLNKENKAFSKCIGLAFAEYTQTGNPVKFKDNDLEACVVEQVNQPVVTAQSASQSSTLQTNPVTPKETPSEKPVEKPKKCSIKFRGICI